MVFLLLLLCGQLLTTRMNVYFTKGASIPSAIEVVDLEKSPQTIEYINRLKQTPNLKVHVTTRFEKEQLNKSTIQGILVLPKNFSEVLVKNETELLNYYTATGIQDTRHIQEVMLSSLLQMKGEALYHNALEESGLVKGEREPELSELFQVVYYNASGSVVTKKTDKPLFTLGLAALFLLLSVLYLQSYLPGEDQRRLAFYGRKTLYQQQGIIGGILLASWLGIVGLFLFLMPRFIGGTFPKNSFLLLLGLLLYCFSLSFFFIHLGKRKWLIVLFVPWFILNMTMGGAVWGVPSENVLLTAFLPVSYVIKGQVLPLYLFSGLFCLTALGLGSKHKKKRVETRT
ncbi:ABC transporter permease [Enterococcus phoeniculicola]|uniref:ABC transporter permease n=1 Tax=Enterococcus phoeniculicola TaxID=154621 RepID=UPI00039BDC7D|nr:ABC transporter permease [Enterococcus phoeniculicola]